MRVNRKIVLAAAALAAVLTAPVAHAAEPSAAPTGEENCFRVIWERLGISDSGESAFSVPAKNGFEAKDGYLYHYTDDVLDTYEPGFVEIDGGIYHISQTGNTIDTYPAGFAIVEDVLCHVSVTGGAFDLYSAGFVEIDGKLYHVSQDGYAIDRYSVGTHEIDGSLYYVDADNSFVTNDYRGHLYFDAEGRYTSGNVTLDGYVEQALAECTTADMTQEQKLRAAYLYVRDHGAYAARPHQARGSTDWAEESALFMFEKKKGNCYCFAGQFLYLARRLGYDAYVVSGGVGQKNSDHAWVMIHDENGTPYIYDVELEWGYRAGKYGKADYNLYKMPVNKTVFRYLFP